MSNLSNLAISTPVLDGPSKSRLALTLFHPHELKDSSVEFKIWTISTELRRKYKKEGEDPLEFGASREYREFDVEGVRRGSYLGGDLIVSVYQPNYGYEADIHFDTHSREGRLIKKVDDWISLETQKMNSGGVF